MYTTPEVPESTLQKIEAAKRETHSAQAHRIVDYLYSHGPTLTGELCQETATQNLSAAANLIRPALEKRGVTIIAKLPDKLSKNRFGDTSMSHEWRIQRLR